jgi:hypothetical protein
MNVPGQAAATTILDRWDQFLTWLFTGWGDFDASARPNAPHRIAARVDAALAADAAHMQAEASQVMREREAAAELTRQHDAPAVSVDEDTRPQPVPQDLDAITNGVAPPPATPDRLTQIDAELKVEFDPDWCTCEGLAAHNAKCGFAPAGLSIGSLLPPPPSPSPYAAAPTEPSPSQP